MQLSLLALLFLAFLGATSVTEAGWTSASAKNRRGPRTFDVDADPEQRRRPRG